MLGAPLLASQNAAVLNTFEYDGRSPSNAVYDGRQSLLALRYDSAAVPAVGRKTSPTAGADEFFSKSARPLAAEGAGVRIAEGAGYESKT